MTRRTSSESAFCIILWLAMKRIPSWSSPRGVGSTAEGVYWSTQFVRVLLSDHLRQHAQHVSARAVVRFDSSLDYHSQDFRHMSGGLLHRAIRRQSALMNTDLCILEGCGHSGSYLRLVG